MLSLLQLHERTVCLSLLQIVVAVNSSMCFWLCDELALRLERSGLNRHLRTLYNIKSQQSGSALVQHYRRQWCNLGRYGSVQILSVRY